MDNTSPVQIGTYKTYDRWTIDLTDPEQTATLITMNRLCRNQTAYPPLYGAPPNSLALGNRRLLVLTDGYELIGPAAGSIERP